MAFDNFHLRPFFTKSVKNLIFIENQFTWKLVEKSFHKPDTLQVRNTFFCSLLKVRLGMWLLSLWLLFPIISTHSLLTIRELVLKSSGWEEKICAWVSSLPGPWKVIHHFWSPLYIIYRQSVPPKASTFHCSTTLTLSF